MSRDPIYREVYGSNVEPAPQGDALVSLLLREFQHRVANSLTILHISLQHQFARITDPSARNVIQTHATQIRSIARLHHFLGGSTNSSSISTEAYFETLCATLTDSFLAPLGLHCEILVDDDVLEADTCVRLGLIVTELVVNAAKHAFPSRANGCVRVELSHQAAQWSCTVSDNGIGSPRIRPGSGSQIVDALITLINGELSVRAGANGTAISIVFPLGGSRFAESGDSAPD